MTATTGVDRLLNLLRKEKDITLSEAAEKLGVEKDQVQQWVDFLVENNRVIVHYKFMTPHITLLDPKGRPDTETQRQTLSKIRKNQKQFITAIKTRDAQSATDALTTIQDLLGDLDDDALVEDIYQEIAAYPDRIQKIGGDPPELQVPKPSKDGSEEQTKPRQTFKDLFGRVKKLSKSGQLQKAKRVLMKIQRKADQTNLSKGMRKQINNKLHKAKHHIETVRQLQNKGEAS